MPIIVVKCPSPADAIAAEAEAATGILWGVSLGTTSTTARRDSTLGIQATETRCGNLGASAPGGWFSSGVFTDADWNAQAPDIQAAFFWGLMDA
jgi:hypothetical protein